jgi:hypothetical protein
LFAGSVPEPTRGCWSCCVAAAAAAAACSVVLRRGASSSSREYSLPNAAGGIAAVRRGEETRVWGTRTRAAGTSSTQGQRRDRSSSSSVCLFFDEEARPALSSIDNSVKHVRTFLAVVKVRPARSTTLGTKAPSLDKMYMHLLLTFFENPRMDDATMAPLPTYFGKASKPGDRGYQSRPGRLQNLLRLFRLEAV